MAAIRSTNTKPEMLIRRGLHARGFRFRLHDPKLPGKPDIALRKYRTVIFVNGCFWHGHECPTFRWPTSRTEFWRAKIAGNVERDLRNLETLRSANWRVAVIWECALKGRERLAPDDVLEELRAWLVGGGDFLAVRSKVHETARTRA